MKWYRPMLWMAAALCLSALLFSPEAQATESGERYYVTMPQTAVTEAARLGLNPQAAWDYGSFHWLQISADDLARLNESGLPFSLDSDAGMLQVTRYRFDPLRDGEPALSEAQRLNHNGAGFRLIQMHGPANNARLEAIAASGAQILQYYPHNSYLVWATAAQTQAVAQLDFVRWQGAFHPAYKINPDLDSLTGKVENVDIFFYNDGRLDNSLQAIAALGGTILQAYPAQPDRTFYIANVQLEAAAFEALAQVNAVLWFGYASPEHGRDDEMSSQIVAGNHPNGIPVVGYAAHIAALGYDGAGVRWATVDTGVDYAHPDLGPRIVGGYSFPGACNPAGQPGQDCSGGGHGTHVAGIIGGDASGGFADINGFLYGMGMAPGHDVIALNALMGSSWPPAGGWQENSKQAVLLGAVGANNSWHTGEGPGMGYRTTERTHDIMVRDGNFDTANVAEPFIQVFSAGNAGPNPTTLTAPKEAKNMIIVANSLNYRVGNINNIATGSSRGPAVDGRLGVTVAAPGSQIASARNSLGGSCSTPIAGTNNLYAFCSGTSMAAPHAAGAIVLATEWWREFNDGANPSPAMAKALLVNHATPMGVIPNFNEGWGRVNVTNIIDPGVETIYYDQTHLFTETGQQWTLNIGVPDPSKPLKITLVWSDAPGAAGANPALVNNLNLTVMNGVNTYRGNVFSGGWSTTGGAYDNLNNLENVYIQNPAGSATIVIDAANIAGDGVPYNGEATDQDFALICSNCALFADFTLTAAPPNLSVCTPDSGLFDITVGSILGFDDPVTLSVTGEPAGTTAAFSPNPVTPPGDSQLTISDMGAAGAGSYALTITGDALTSTQSVGVNLHVFTQSPGAPGLVSPGNGATNVGLQPTLSWSAAGQGQSYTVEVATDAAFNNIVESATVNETSYTTTGLTSSSIYYWRARAANSCGAGANSAVFIFSTAALPGDCGPGTSPNLLYSYGFEDGPAGWTTGGTSSTWAISSANPFAGDFHYRGAGSSSVSDQRLTSPAIALPAGQNPVVLNFWHTPNLEPNGATACYDGGVLEVSANGGATWSYVPNSSLLVGPYRSGTISGSFGNPLAGLNGWCGVTTYMNTIADLSAYAGETVQFRMRLGTDSSVGTIGWDVDNVMVQSCTVAHNALLTPFSETTVIAGETAVHEFVIVNIGQDDVYDLTIAGDAWPTTLHNSATLTLTAGMTATIAVSVEAPMLLGSDTFTLTVQSQGDPELVLTAVGRTVSEAELGLTLSGDSELWSAFGMTTTHTIVITNTSEITESFSLEIVAGHRWTTWADATAIGPLAPGASVEFAVHVLVGLGATDTAVIRLRSAIDPEVYATAHLTTRTHLLFVPMLQR